MKNLQTFRQLILLFVLTIWAAGPAWAQLDLPADSLIFRRPAQSISGLKLLPENKKISREIIGFKLNLAYENSFVFEPGIMLLWGEVSSHPPMVIWLTGPSASLKIAYRDRQFFLAPKLAYEYHFLFLSARLGVSDFTDFNLHAPKLEPEIGLNFFGMIYMTYGYNFPLNNNLPEFDGHKITLGVNWAKI